MSDSCCGSLSQWKTGCVASVSGMIENDSYCGNGNCCAISVWKVGCMLAGGLFLFFFFAMCLRQQRRRRLAYANGQVVNNQYGQPIIQQQQQPGMIVQQQPGMVGQQQQQCSPAGGVYGQPASPYGQPAGQVQPVANSPYAQPVSGGGWGGEPVAQQQYGQPGYAQPTPQPVQAM